ncbi:MAG: MBL fold metallo-hydrolase [Bacteroidales bacterium]|jgi:7,8-dihydropterin-6-yl-methyl-4-(beta-D-ribofuranosyl)aminobenzene 5'-phosphate synthase|nr:MBL fold metallo-hydrolase [Bacteroidales bacterium]MDD2824837.1 MBL fold metallo-hydrolase [Bacteroidales bacterium]MDD3100129.1 MBL fold metallo-hydrolase [Bacteroidales bacterium]MDD3639268.1 MBL fold metallo-hydrolase [Bacteroidales bacterium]MDD3944004.1 MBL fold metallo-hydrolase [Bacteroidales bacterium]
MDILEILINDHPAPEGSDFTSYITEHGLSIWFEKDGKKWLVDTGASGNFAKNAFSSGLDPAQTDHLVLSHNHYDHTGGLGVFLKMNSRAVIHLSEAVRQSTCYSVRNGIRKDIGLDRSLTSLYPSRFQWHPARNISLSEHVLLLADIPADPPLPKANKLLLWEKDGTTCQDPFDHEMAVLVIGDKGSTVISSCTHKGILNVLRACGAVSKKPITHFVGGTHLKDGFESEEDLLWIASRIEQDYPLLHIFTGHCSGEVVIRSLGTYLPGKVNTFYPGFRILL